VGLDGNELVQVTGLPGRRMLAFSLLLGAIGGVISGAFGGLIGGAVASARPFPGVWAALLGGIVIHTNSTCLSWSERMPSRPFPPKGGGDPRTLNYIHESYSGHVSSAAA
jgi:hypothetical protein